MRCVAVCCTVLHCVAACCRRLDLDAPSLLDGYCSTVQGLLDCFELDLGFTELLFIQIHLCVMRVLVLYSFFLIFFMGTVALYRVCSTGLR